MEMPPTFSAGDGAAGPPPQPGAEVAALLVQLLEEQKKQTELLHRILLGDLDTLSMADVKVALGCGDRKVDELIEDGELPVFQFAERGPRRILRDTFRTVLRRWAERERR
jgi:hypothetical protein